MNRLEEIKRYLTFNKHAEGIEYQSGMEVMIKVAQDDGDMIPGKTGAYTNGTDEWYNIRIASLVDEQKKLTYPTKYIEAIGMSGWNFKEQKSIFVGFDFDSITGHKKGLSEQDLNEIITKAKEIEWVEIRRSTSGRGLHLYVWFGDNSPEVATRKDHIQLAKSILSTMSGLLGFDFKSKIDTCGTILWCCHRKATGPDSFVLVKPRTRPIDKNSIPPNWKEIGKKDKKLQELSANLSISQLDVDQQMLLKWFTKHPSTWWWDAELNMLVCHTFDLAQAHADLKFKGFFFTNSTGKDCPNDQNCFCFPVKNGAWVVRRHNPGTKEHPTWKTDASGWTYNYYNRVPTLEDLAGLYNGEPNAKGDYVFSDASAILKVVEHLSPTTNLNIPHWLSTRSFRVRELPDAKIVIFCDRLGESDPILPGWIANKRSFEKVISILKEEVEIKAPDELIRHVVSEEKSAGWFLNIKNCWIDEPQTNLMSALATFGYKRQQMTELLGQCILNPWMIVNKPFENEYPGNREWNKYSPQLKYTPKQGQCFTWMKILNHVGQSLNDAVKNDSWCIAHNVQTGGEYLKFWVASLFQFPYEPLPYLFFWGPQLSGKSTFHEALAMLVTKGVARAEIALKSQSNFNAELIGAILCVIEELDLSKTKGVVEKVKDWVTSKFISYHEKGKTPVSLVNTSHWIQVANNPSFCPIQLGDTRIVVFHVPLPRFIMTREELNFALREEAPAFLFEILNLEIPPPKDRLRVPVVESTEKQEEQHSSANLVERFIIECMEPNNGSIVSFSEFYAKFKMWLHDEGFPASAQDWSKISVSRSIPLIASMPLKGKCGDGGALHLANFAFKPVSDEEKKLMFKWVKKGETLIKETV